jgi:hypothetical protein
MRLASIIIAALAVALPVEAGADAPPRATSTDVAVPAGGGQYEIRVNPELITSLFLPEPIDRVLASNQKDFTVRQMDDTSVAVKPNKADPKLTGNVVITTASLRITVVLNVVDDPAEAHAQVNFRKAEVEEALQKRIDAEVERRLAEARANIEREVERRIAARIYQRFGQDRLTAVERNSDNVVVRVADAVHLGSDVYLRFEIQNRSGSVYRPTRIAVKSGGKDVGGTVVFAGKVARGPVLGEVPAGGRATALVAVRGTDDLAEDEVSLELAESGGKRAVRVGGIRVR